MLGDLVGHGLRGEASSGRSTRRRRGGRGRLLAPRGRRSRQRQRRSAAKSPRDLLLADASSLALHRDLLSQAQEDLAPHVVRELGRLPRKEEARRTPFPRNEDDVVGAKHLARAITEVPHGYDTHVTTTMVTL